LIITLSEDVKARVGRSGGYYGVCGFITDAEDAAGGRVAGW
jgi:hypothetical protein